MKHLFYELMRTKVISRNKFSGKDGIKLHWYMDGILSFPSFSLYTFILFIKTQQILPYRKISGAQFSCIIVIYYICSL